jgi:hypothetical protein
MSLGVIRHRPSPLTGCALGAWRRVSGKTAQVYRYSGNRINVTIA